MRNLLDALRSADGATRRSALADLNELVGTAFGEAGLELGRAVREHDGVTLLTSLIADPDPAIHQQALLCLGNLASDSVDPDSALTKQALIECGSAKLIMACAFSEDLDLLVPACGVLQNVCCDRTWAELVVAHRVDVRLEQLSSSDDELVRRYAAGALTNLVQSLTDEGALSNTALRLVEERMRQAEIENFNARRALGRISRGVADMSIGSRTRRVVTAKQRLAAVLASDNAPAARKQARPSSASSSGSYVSACTSLTTSTTG